MLVLGRQVEGRGSGDVSEVKATAAAVEEQCDDGVVVVTRRHAARVVGAGEGGVQRGAGAGVEGVGVGEVAVEEEVDGVGEAAAGGKVQRRLPLLPIVALPIRRVDVDVAQEDVEQPAVAVFSR